MLPLKAGTLTLSAEAKQKLDFFYSHYCTGTNRALYGISHIIYACHASFPLIISPELANLTWLNFNSYTNYDGLQKIDKIVVSDFLLSALVRPVANRQFEVIPEIRNYLLYLLKDGRWFGLFGVEQFGDKRLSGLALFLRQYLNDKRSSRQNYSSGYKDINEWAVLAYLEPDQLAYKIAEAFEKTFDSDESNPIDSFGQLRLNMLMDRFDQQINGQGISAKTENKAFVNLHAYSKANRDRLFGQAEALSDLVDNLDDSFIADSDHTKSFIQLPFEKVTGERLNRKKKKQQRILSLFVALDNYEDKSIVNTHGCIEGAYFLSNTINSIAEKNNIEIESNVLANEHAVIAEIINQLTLYGNKAEKEDIILIYLSGHFINIGNNSLFPGYDTVFSDYSGGFMNAISLKQILEFAKGNKVVLILDGKVNALAWSKGIDVLMSVVRNGEGEVPAADFGEHGYMNALSYFLSMQISYNGTQIAYNDLKKIISNNITSSQLLAGHSYQPAFFISENGAINNYFLSNKVSNVSGGFVLTYNKNAETWQVLDDDFLIVPADRANEVYEYHSGENIPGINGEIYISKPTIIFEGSTERLNSNRIYKVRPAKPILYYSTGGNAISEQQDALAEVVEMFETFKHDDYSAWGLMQQQQLDENRKDYHEIIYKNWLRVFVLNTEMPTKYELEYLNNVNSTGITSQAKWFITGKNLLINAIGKFVRYHYLSNISLPVKDYIGYTPFNIDINYWLTSKKKEHNLIEQGRGLLLTPDMISFDNGEIYFHSYNIEIISNESFPVFFDAYILTSDLAIRKLSPDKNNIIEPGKFAQVLFGEADIIEQMLMEEITGEVKFLLSKDPITVNFSQAAVNKIE